MHTKVTASKLTSKYQATIPDNIRKILDLKAGDIVTFEVIGGEVNLKKGKGIDLEFASALTPTLSEWSSDNDEEAYADL